MTIARKLYLGFGAILAIMMALFVLSILTLSREHRTRSVATATLSDMQTIEGIRFKVLIEGLELRNYLLSGDVRDEDKTNKIHGDLMNALHDGSTSSQDASLRATLSQVEDGERAW